MNGALPGVPQLSFGLVDVRDVADIHLRAMIHPAAAGERFLAIADDFVSMQEIARVLKSRVGDTASRVPTRVLPNWIVRLAASDHPLARADAHRAGQGEARQQREGEAPPRLASTIE